MTQATECPDCGNGFYGYKCACGYKTPFKRPTEETVSSPGCTAHGCPMPGTISDSTRPPHSWLCRFHFGEPPDRWQRITRWIRSQPEGLDKLINAPFEFARDAADVVNGESFRNVY